MVENSATASVVVNGTNGSLVQSSKGQEQQYYAVRVTSEKAAAAAATKLDNGLSKIVHANAPQQMAAYNLNAINLASLKSTFSKSDGINEIINIEPDTLNSIISNSNLRKYKGKCGAGGKKSEKTDVLLDNNMIQIDLTHSENAYEIPLKNEKLKSTPEPKYMYTFKIEESSKNPAIVLNQIPANVPQIQNFDPSLINLASSMPPNSINVNTNNKQDSEANLPLKTAAAMNSSILGSLSNNLNLNLTGTNLNIVASNMNQGIIPNLSNTNQNVQMASTMNLSNLPPVTTNVNNQNINLNVAASYSNVSQSFATTPVNTYQNSTVNKNVLANLAVISRISNLNRNKNPAVPQEVGENPNNSSSSFNTTVVFNGNPSSTTESNNASGVPTTTTTKTHMCDICQKIFKRREHLYQHVKLHTGFRPFVCDHCSKSFMRKEHLLRHMISHSGQKNYTCNICDKSFSRNDNLLKHKKTHEKQQSFTCEVCQKQFVMKHYYLAHKMAHEDEKVSFNQTWNNIVKV